jgi:hypothetical protein
MTVIGGTWYGGEMKKGIFTIMNYFLPLQQIGAFHCSANEGRDGRTALFFGLSGTGKTTLSTDPNRALIGDDEHGWDNDGVFNFEGGCYAKTIDLSPETEPEIYAAIRRDALLENVKVDAEGKRRFHDTSKTQNGRVSYPIYHIDNIVKPVSKGGHPSHIIFLTCDAFGVLPPVAKLSKGQAMYQYLSGYTAKVAGTELGVTEPTATFSSCFGAPFLALHPTSLLDDPGAEDGRARIESLPGEYGLVGRELRRREADEPEGHAPHHRRDLRRVDRVRRDRDDAGLWAGNSEGPAGCRRDAAEPPEHVGGQGGVRRHGAQGRGHVRGQFQAVHGH